MSTKSPQKADGAKRPSSPSDGCQGGKAKKYGKTIVRSPSDGCQGGKANSSSSSKAVVLSPSDGCQGGKAEKDDKTTTRPPSEGCQGTKDSSSSSSKAVVLKPSDGCQGDQASDDAEAALAAELSQPSAYRPSDSRTVERSQLRLSYYPTFLTAGVAGRLFRLLERRVAYYGPDIARVFVHGKWHATPRQLCAYGDSGVAYSYSGTRVPAMPWLPSLEAIRDALRDATGGVEFNFALVNRYATGDNYIGEHRDSEADLDPAAPIASLSLGAQRDFYFRQPLIGQRVDLSLASGSLLLMHPPTNQHWLHSLPKRKRVVLPRINLTYRRIVVRPRP